MLFRRLAAVAAMVLALASLTLAAYTAVSQFLRGLLGLVAAALPDNAWGGMRALVRIAFTGSA